MSDESQNKPGKTERRNDETGRDGRHGHGDRLERGFDALRQLRESTKREAMPDRLRAVLEKLRRQN